MFDFQKTINLLRSALLEPEAAWRSWLDESADWQKTAFIITIPLVVTVVVARYLLGFVFANPFMTGGGVVGILRTIVFTLIGLAVAAFLFSFFAGIFKGRRDFARGLAAISLAAVPGYAGSILGPVPWLGWIISLGLAIYGLVLLYRIQPVYLDVPQDKRVVHFVVSLLACAVAMFIIATVLGVQTMSDSVPRNTAGLSQQADLVELAMADQYEPPDDGKLSVDQVENYISARQASAELAREHAAKLKARMPEDGEDGDLADLFGSVQDFMGASTAEIRAVKLLDGNWAEHQWVGNQLLRARLQPEADDASAHNFEIYQRFEDVIAAL